MPEQTEIPTHPSKVSEVDRAYRHGVPGPNRWSIALLMAFVLALFAASYFEPEQPFPNSFRAAFLDWYGSTETPN